MTTEQFKARTTALAFPIRVSSFLSRLSLLANVTQRYLSFSTCFSVTPFTCCSYWSGFFEKWRPILQFPIFQLIFCTELFFFSNNSKILLLSHRNFLDAVAVPLATILHLKNFAKFNTLASKKFVRRHPLTYICICHKSSFTIIPMIGGRQTTNHMQWRHQNFFIQEFFVGQRYRITC